MGLPIPVIVMMGFALILAGTVVVYFIADRFGIKLPKTLFLFFVSTYIVTMMYIMTGIELGWFSGWEWYIYEVFRVLVPISLITILFWGLDLYKKEKNSDESKEKQGDDAKENEDINEGEDSAGKVW